MQQILSTSVQTAPENFCFKFNDFHQPVRFIYFEQPSYAVTASKDKLSQEEKIERAYNLERHWSFRRG